MADAALPDCVNFEFQRPNGWCRLFSAPCVVAADSGTKYEDLLANDADQVLPGWTIYQVDNAHKNDYQRCYVSRIGIEAESTSFRQDRYVDMYELIQFIQPSETDYHVCTHKSIACPTTAITAVNVPGYDVLRLDQELLKAVNQLRAQPAQYRTKL